jgi:hypothetical protein
VSGTGDPAPPLTQPQLMIRESTAPPREAARLRRA